MTAISVNPDDPFAGLTVSADIDKDAIMSNQPNLHGLLVTALRPDDQSGRDVLYPAVMTCLGDCDGNGVVTVDELVRGVNIALGASTADACAQFDRDHGGQVTVDELVEAVGNALQGCSSL